MYPMMCASGVPRPVPYSNTSMIGKSHLGHRELHNPLSFGFDDYFGIPYSHDYCPCPCELTRTKDCTCRDNLPPCPVFDNHEIVEQPAHLPTLDEQYTQRALDILDARAEAESPFLLYMAYQHSHHPQYASQRFSNSSARGAYGDSMLEADYR